MLNYEGNLKKINELLNKEVRYIWVEGTPGSGKSHLAKKIFEMRIDFCRIFIGGCNPSFRSRIIGLLFQIIEELKLMLPSEKWLIIFDEFDDEQSLSRIINRKFNNIYYIVFSNQKCHYSFMKEIEIELDNSIIQKKSIINAMSLEAKMYIEKNFNIGKIIYLEEEYKKKIKN